MKCMYCNCMDSRVVDSRPTEEGTVIRRRRECEKCGKRFTTYEKVESITLLVIKKDNRREAFDADKLRKGIVKACEKRPISLPTIDNMVQKIEMEVCNNLAQEISSTQIGELVMEALRKLDQVAYVRFASVYRHFRDIQSFMNELTQLLKHAENTDSSLQ